MAKRTHKIVAVALVAGTFTAVGFLVSAASAALCGGTATSDCSNPASGVINTASYETAVVGYEAQRRVVLADSAYGAISQKVVSVGGPNLGDVSTPSVGGVVPHIGPVGPTPVGDGFKRVARTVGTAFGTYDRVVSGLPNGGDVSTPSVGGVVPHIGPVGPAPVGDLLRRAVVDPVVGSASKSASAKLP